MGLAEFEALVKDEANKGDRLDAGITLRVPLAIQRAERKYTLKYMEREVDLTLAVGENSIELPAQVKSINYMRYPDTNPSVLSNTWAYLNQVDPMDIVRDSGCNPEGYYLDGLERIVFDNTVTEAITYNFGYNAYTDVTEPIADDHWLLLNAQDWLLCEMMKLLSTTAKEPRWRQDYLPTQEEAEADLFRADNELRNNDRNFVMVPPGSYGSRRRYRNDDGL